MKIEFGLKIYYLYCEQKRSKRHPYSIYATHKNDVYVDTIAFVDKKTRDMYAKSNFKKDDKWAVYKLKRLK